MLLMFLRLCTFNLFPFLPGLSANPLIRAKVTRKHRFNNYQHHHPKDSPTLKAIEHSSATLALRFISIFINRFYVYESGHDY
jgi:hypothetical protein